MSVTRINLFRANPGDGEALRSHLASFIPSIRQLPGCISCQMLEQWEEPTRIAIIEVWESVEAHKASVAAIPPESVERAVQLLAGPVEGGYYTTVEA